MLEELIRVPGDKPSTNLEREPLKGLVEPIPGSLRTSLYRQEAVGALIAVEESYVQVPYLLPAETVIGCQAGDSSKEGLNHLCLERLMCRTIRLPILAIFTFPRASIP